MFRSGILVLLGTGCLLGCAQKSKDREMELAVTGREKEKGHRVESFEVKSQKEKSPQSHTFYYEAHVTDTTSGKEQALTVQDSVWLYQRNDSTWVAVPK